MQSIGGTQYVKLRSTPQSWQTENFRISSWEFTASFKSLAIFTSLHIGLGLGQSQKIYLVQTWKLTKLTWYICLRLYITRHTTGKLLTISYWVAPWNRAEFDLNEVIFVAECIMNLKQGWRKECEIGLTIWEKPQPDNYWCDHNFERFLTANGKFLVRPRSKWSDRFRRPCQEIVAITGLQPYRR